MSDDTSNLLSDGSTKARLFADATILSLKGAGFGAMLFVGIGVMIWIIWLIGQVLPPESKERPDPTPWSYII